MSFYVFCCGILCLMCVKIASSNNKEDYPISNYIMNLGLRIFNNGSSPADIKLTFGAIRSIIVREKMDTSFFQYYMDEETHPSIERSFVSSIFTASHNLMKIDEGILKNQLSNNGTKTDGLAKKEFAKQVFLKSNLFRGILSEKVLDNIIEKCKVDNDNINYKDMIKIITDGSVDNELYLIWKTKSTDDTLTTSTHS
ncbi:uncharacterized protein LOC126895198 isoform X2 [Daktulosphaira vitifoliae]|uniref:uncharacterized protein LOC126895198 isoform X2 n=1 Tax=Daktulosphaira vitifoliae TaxID=58002 RepID=UPI0021A9C205|nr:uncharacterized protein LOC126895198 isoform X2 [Daktulosphaira vitifoliae]